MSQSRDVVGRFTECSSSWFRCQARAGVVTRAMSGQQAGRGGGRWGRGGRMRASERPVDEDTRIDITQMLRDFQASDETELVCPPSLTNHERAVIHTECRKYGFVSKSYGKGDERRIHVRKPPKKVRQETFLMPLDPQSLSVLASHMAHFPPSPKEVGEALRDGFGAEGGWRERKAAGDGGGTMDTPAEGHKRRRAGPHAALMSRDECLRMFAESQARAGSAKLAEVQRARASLPIVAHREEILAAVRDHRVVLVAGETGCGKTTQVPQFLLDDCWARGEPCRLMCTQPRRVSAITVAERVAFERNESLGQNVGYTIRLESKGGDHCPIMFCTNGVLMRMLTAGEGLSGITHVVVDEIHERDRFADFLLIIIRDVLATHPSLRIVLMSATLHVDLFSSYFGGCPVVRVPGTVHPVVDCYLEDVLKLTDYVGRVGLTMEQMARATEDLRGSRTRARPAVAPGSAEARRCEAAISAAFLSGTDADFYELLESTGAAEGGGDTDASPLVNHQHPDTGASPLMVAAGKGRVDVVEALLANGADPSLQARNGMVARDWATQFGHTEAASLLEAFERQKREQDAVASDTIALAHYQLNAPAEEIDTALVVRLLEYIRCGGQGGRPIVDGAVLVFLPGWDDILRVRDALESHPKGLFRPDTHVVLPLHSMIPSAEQRKVFKRPPPGVGKIVLSTNIAETAVTIDDVVCVVDAGRLKEKSYDPYTGVGTLQSSWISKASERQRRGRAGRCQPGVCFHLYSRTRSLSLQDFQPPEIKRSPLDELALQVKLLGPLAGGGAGDVRIEEFLAKAPEPPLSHAISAAVTLLEDIGAVDGQQRLTRMGRHLAALPLSPRVGKLLLLSVLFQCLDPMLTVACASAYRDPFVAPMDSASRRAANAIRKRMSQAGGGDSDHLTVVVALREWEAAREKGDDFRYCARNFLSPATMNMLDGMRRQLLGELQNRSLVRSLAEASAHMSDIGVLRGVIACGMYPQVGRLMEVQPGNVASQRATIVTRKGDKVKIHPGSVNADLQGPLRDPADPSPDLELPQLVAHDDLVRGDAATFVRTCTTVGPHALVLACHSLRVEGGGEAWAAFARVAGTGANGDAEEDDGAGTPMGRGGVEVEDGGDVGADLDGAVLTADGWLRFLVDDAAAPALVTLRHRLTQAFAWLVERPGQPMPAHHASAVQAIRSLFSAEGGLAVMHDPRRATMAGPSRGPGRGYGRGPPRAVVVEPLQQSGGQGRGGGYSRGGGSGASGRGGGRGQGAEGGGRRGRGGGGQAGGGEGRGYGGGREGYGGGRGRPRQGGGGARGTGRGRGIAVAPL